MTAKAANTVELLLGAMERGQRPPAPITLDVRVVLRQSTDQPS
jgi:DNA-binding LacI/PurR family transcriptional regulator